MNAETKILNYLKLRGKSGATKAQIWEACRVWNIGGRVYDLRMKGHQIVTRMMKTNNGMIGRYFYVKSEK